MSITWFKQTAKYNGEVPATESVLEGPSAHCRPHLYRAAGTLFPTGAPFSYVIIYNHI
jgi:hypothetical protein